MMTTLFRRWMTGVCLVLAPIAHAHPGHDGHELTWEIRHLAQHPFATIGCAAVFGALIALVVQLLRGRSEPRCQSLRGSHPARGK